MKHSYRSSLFLILLIAGSCSAQPPPTIQQSLAREGIGTSNEDLLKALHSPIGRIRGMAAVQLADNRDRSAIPALNRALQDEQDANERLNIARALNVFSDPRGGETMAKLCADGSLREDLRLEAAGELQASGHENCFASVAEILSATHVPALKLAALDYLNRSHTELTPATEQYLVVTLGLMKSLKSEIAMVRQRATACIVRYHITAARSYLRAAAEKETDPATKAAMESAAKAMSK